MALPLHSSVAYTAEPLASLLPLRPRPTKILFAMAAAALPSLRASVHSTIAAVLPSRSSSSSCSSFPSLPPYSLLKPTTTVRSLLLPPLPLFRLSQPLLLPADPAFSHHRLRPRPPSSAVHAAAAYADTDDDEGDQFPQQPQTEKSRPRSASADESGRLYVGNLPFSMTPAQLAEIFGQAGIVETVEVVYDRATERSRGFAFVTMASADEAHEAIRMFDGSQVGGRAVRVNFPEVPRGGEREVMMSPRMRGGGARGFTDSPYKLYAGNLGWNVTSQGLQDTFASQPGLLGAKVIFERDTGRSRGFGFVSFTSAEECQAAIEAMNGVEVEGRPLRLSLAEGRSSVNASGSNSEGAGTQDSSLASTLSY